MPEIHFSASPIRDYHTAHQANSHIHEALFLFGLNRGLYLSSGVALLYLHGDT